VYITNILKNLTSSKKEQKTLLAFERRLPEFQKYMKRLKEEEFNALQKEM